ncbi:uncharacterized protein [Eurosta solidaginis]|uniref:uncharacterized protein n=1 Tax=Eurosta solidaginis TaxID=178769 RepID=UPI0035309326
MLKIVCFFILQFAIGCLWIECKQQQCYRLKYLNYSYNDSPDYRVSMLWKNQYSFMTLTQVSKAVQLPIWSVNISQHLIKRNQPPKLLHNGTYKTCEFWKNIKQINIINTFAEQLFFKSGSNLSMECPLPVGTYVLKNIHIPSDSNILRYMYWPNTLYSFVGAVYNEQPNKTLERLCNYEVNATVIKSC